MRPRAIGGDEVQPAGHDICGVDGVLWLPLRRLSLRRLFGGRVVAATYVALRRCALGCDRWFSGALIDFAMQTRFVALWLPK